MFKKINFLNYKDIKLKKILKKDLEILRNERNSLHIRQRMISQSIISKKNQNKWYKKIINEKNSKYLIYFIKMN